MIKKILEMKTQKPISTVKHPGLKPLKSQKSEISSTNSVQLTSSNNLQTLNSPNKKSPNTKQQNYMASSNPQTTANNNSKPSVGNRDTLTSQSNIPKHKVKFEQIKQNITQRKELLQEKMQNVSCLYSNFIYKNTPLNFVDDMKLQRYRIMLENERVQKNQLMKDIQEINQKLAESQKEKDTVMFAYRALQAKIKQKQKLNRYRMRHKKEKLSINMVNGSCNGDQIHDDDEISLAYFENQLLRSRQMLTSQGILGLDDQHQGQSQKFMSCLKNACSSKSITKYLQRSDGIKEWEEKQKKFTEMQTQLQQLRPKIQSLQQQNSYLLNQQTSLQQQLNQLKIQHFSLTQKQKSQQEHISKLQSQILSLTQQNTQIQAKYNQISFKFKDQQKQAERKQRIIIDLQNTKYTYLMKQEKEKQEIQLLRKFTQNLQLNDAKINQFIKTTFGEKLQDQVQSEDKLYKEDISYILHLIKKKQNIYNQLINQYQEKHRQTQTRCFLLEKKLHLTDLFLKKLQAFIQSENDKIQLSKITNAKQQNNKQEMNKVNSSTVQRLNQMLMTYQLDRRIV